MFRLPLERQPAVRLPTIYTVARTALDIYIIVIAWLPTFLLGRVYVIRLCMVVGAHPVEAIFVSVCTDYIFDDMTSSPLHFL